MLQWLGRKKRVEGLVGLSVNDTRVSLAHVIRRGDDVVLEQCVRHVFEGAEPLAVQLEALVESLGLAGADCNLVLSPKDYNIFLVEAPQVEPQEVAAAVRWKIKDLLDMPIEDAILDVFPLPDDAASRGRGNMIYVAVASRQTIERYVHLLDNSGLQLQYIDVPEMVMRNITSRFADDRNGLAFIALKESGSIMNITRAGQLYLTRKINTVIGPDVMMESDWEMTRDRLALEIQRSLDYFESQMGQNPVSQLMIAPRAKDTESMMNSLGEALASPVGMLDFANDLESAESLTPELKGSCMVAIGAALRTPDNSQRSVGQSPVSHSPVSHQDPANKRRETA